MSKVQKRSKLKIIIGDKNLSSWSLRPWLVLAESGLEFDEVLVRLDRTDTKTNIAKFSPSGKVPALHHGKLVIWDSLSICEYIAEIAPKDNSLWPRDANARALARSYVAEMHSGFSNLRAQLSMDTKLRIKVNHLTDGTVSDLNRIFSLWRAALIAFEGKFLFGDKFGIVDSFFAPVVLRLISYGVAIKDPLIESYIERVVNHAPLKKWLKAASAEEPVKQVFQKIAKAKLSF